MTVESTIWPGVRAMFTDYLQLAPGETVVVLAESPDSPSAAALAADERDDVFQRMQLATEVADLAAAQYPDNSIQLVPYPLTSCDGSEPPALVADALATAQVVVALTTHSVTHTHALQQARQRNVRGVSMPGAIATMFAINGPITVDRARIARDAQRMAQALTAAQSVHLITLDGTNLHLSIAGVTGRWSSGQLDQPGQIGNLPFGEAYLAPVEGSAHGTLVVPAGCHPRLDTALVLRFDHGLVQNITGGGEAGARLRKLLHDPEAGQARRNCAELGIGSNPGAQRPDIVLEAEKIKGTVHIALGNNSSMGGTVEADLHQDFVVPTPTLVLNQRPVIVDGIWQI